MKKDKPAAPTRVSMSRTETRLTAICQECLLLISQLRANKDFGEPEILTKRIQELVGKIERESRAAGFSEETIHQAIFALVAFIDETVIASEWKHKDRWLSNPLQLQLFNRYDAGEEFFIRLEKFRQRPEYYGDILELYFLSLALGFKGKYQFVGKEKLLELLEMTYSELRQGGGRRLLSLSPHGSTGGEVLEVVREIPLWFLGIGAVAIGFFLYIIMNILTAKAANHVALFLDKIG